MKFNTKFERVNHSKPEIFPEKSRIDLLSYIPKDRQIQALIMAGQRLKGRGVYDLNPDSKETIDDIECDPTRRKGFDLAEASQVLKNLEDKAESIKRVKNGPNSLSRSELGPLTPQESKKDITVDPEKVKEA